MKSLLLAWKYVIKLQMFKRLCNYVIKATLLDYETIYKGKQFENGLQEKRAERQGGCLWTMNERIS